MSINHHQPPPNPLIRVNPSAETPLLQSENEQSSFSVNSSDPESFPTSNSAHGANDQYFSHFASPSSLPKIIKIYTALVALRPFNVLFPLSTDSKMWKRVAAFCLSWLYILAFLGYSIYSVVYFINKDGSSVSTYLTSLFSLATYCFGLVLNHFAEIPHKVRQMVWIQTSRYLDKASQSVGRGVTEGSPAALHHWTRSLSRSSTKLLISEYVLLFIIPFLIGISIGLRGGLELPNTDSETNSFGIAPWYAVSAIVYPIWLLRSMAIFHILGQYLLICISLAILVHQLSTGITLHPNVFTTPKEAFSKFYQIEDLISECSRWYSYLILPYILFSSIWITNFMFQFGREKTNDQVTLNYILFSILYVVYLFVPPALINWYFDDLVRQTERIAAFAESWTSEWDRFLSFLRNHKVGFRIGYLIFTASESGFVFYLLFMILVIAYNLG